MIHYNKYNPQIGLKVIVICVSKHIALLWSVRPKGSNVDSTSSTQHRVEENHLVPGAISTKNIEQFGC